MSVIDCSSYVYQILGLFFHKHYPKLLKKEFGMVVCESERERAAFFFFFFF